MLRFPQYRNILGAPREGVHSARIPVIDMAAFDVVGTILIALIVWWLLGYRTVLSYLTVLLSLYIFAEILHYFFCVPTRLQVMLGVA
jgi:hypothetical protein